MGKQRKNYPLRLPADLFEEIRRWAEQEMRSVNGQMEYILRQAVRGRSRSADNENTTEQNAIEENTDESQHD